jgi:hypothetical protein
MPDRTKQTISATQIAALYDASPYVTRWMLYHQMLGDIPIEIDSRMRWGLKMQPLLLAQAAEDLKLLVQPNADDHYMRRGFLGCTRDATIVCPDRGPGALETKCVFDYRTWMTDYGGGAFVPRHHELQLQQQMTVGGEESYRWGVIAVWVAGDMHYFERKPISGLGDKLQDAAEGFLSDVRERREPEPFGVPIEVPWLQELYPCVRGQIVDRSSDLDLADAAILYRDAREQEAAGKRTADALRARLLGAALDAEEMLLGHGVKVSIRPHGKGKRISVYQSGALNGGTVPDDILMGG